MKKFFPVIIFLLFFLVACHNDNDDGKSNVDSGQIDTTPPHEVTNLAVTELDTALKLTWELPEDPDLAGVLIIRRTDTYPSDNTTDGTQIYKGLSTTFIDNGLENNKRYYYRVFTFDKSGNYSHGVTASGVPRHNYTELDIPAVSNPHIDFLNPLGHIEVKWEQPTFDVDWVYRIKLSNPAGSWSFDRDTTTLEISRIPLTTPSINTINIQTCMPDYSMCNSGVTLKFSLPTMEALYPTGEIFYRDTSYTNGEVAIDTSGTSLIYKTGNMLSLYENSPTSKLLLPVTWGDNDYLLRSSGFYDFIRNLYFVHVLSTGDSGNIHSLKLSRVTFNPAEVTSTAEYTITPVDYDSDTPFTCADFLPTSPTSTIGSGPYFIYAKEGDLYLANENGKIISNLVYSSPVTIAQCRSFILPDGGIGVVLALQSYRNDTYTGNYKIQILSLDTVTPEANLLYEKELGNIMNPVISTGYLQSSNNIPLILLGYNEADTYKNPQLTLITYTDGQWRQIDLASFIYKFSTQSLIDLHLHIDPLSNTGYAVTITSPLVSFNFVIYSYVNIVPIKTYNSSVTVASDSTETIEIKTYNGINNPIGIRMVSPDMFYTANINYTKGSLITTFQKDQSQSWTMEDFYPYTFNHVRGDEGYTIASRDTVTQLYLFEGNSTQVLSLNPPARKGEDFSVIKDSTGKYNIVYINDNAPNEIYANTNPSAPSGEIYTTPSSFQFITSPDYYPALSLFSFWNSSDLFLAEKKEGAWKVTPIAGSSSFICPFLNLYPFYSVITTAPEKGQMRTFFFDNQMKLYSVIWEDGKANCYTYPYTVTGGLDHLAVASDEDKFYLTVSYHLNSGETPGDVISDLLIFDMNDWNSYITYRIKDAATMAVPVTSSYVYGSTPIIVYFNPFEQAVKYVPLTLCKDGICADTNFLSSAAIENKAKIIRPYIFYNHDGKTAIQLTDKNGRAIRIIP